MKKIILALIATALFVGCTPKPVEAQTTPVYVTFKSAGSHTRGAVQNVFTWASIQADTISNNDTLRDLTVGAAAKTINNAWTLSKPNIVYDSIRVTGNYKSASIMVTLLKVSGTVADTAYLLGSVNGVDWITIGQDTALFTNVTYRQKYVWELPGRLRPTNSVLPWNSVNAQFAVYNQRPDDLPYQYYAVYVRGMNATQAAIVKVVGIFRQGP